MFYRLRKRLGLSETYTPGEKGADFYDERFEEDEGSKGHFTDSPYYPVWTVIVDRLRRTTQRKFLELGGFDPLLHPFYVEDADISYMAWKRGWKVLYAPGSMVYHEHRGTIGKRFSSHYISRILRKNQILVVWKNIHEPGKLDGVSDSY